MKQKLFAWLLALCLLVSLTPVRALAGDIEIIDAEDGILIVDPADAQAQAEGTLRNGSVPVCIIDETTGSEFTQMHGKVTLPEYAYYGDYVREKYFLSRGDTVTLLAEPDEGYALGSLRVTYKTHANGPDKTLARDEATGTFKLPARGPVSVTIYVSFVSLYEDYAVTVTVLDGGTGNTVTADRERADEGELITVTVSMNPDTRFDALGLIVHESGDASALLKLTQLDESRYTFRMPASDVDILARFEPVEAEVYTISFPDYSPVLTTLLYRNGEYQQGIYFDPDTWQTNETGLGSAGDEIRLEIRSGGGDTVTGAVLHYELDGQPREETLTVTTAPNRISSVQTGFTMPAADVRVELILTPYYRIYLESNHYGSAKLSASEAFAGQEITLTATVTDPLCSNLIWSAAIFGGGEDLPYTLEQKDGQTSVMKITMPADTVTLGVDFARTPVPYVSRGLNEYRPVVEEEERELLVYTLLTEAGDSAILSDELYEGWYVVDGTVEYGNRTMLRINGDVKLILKDGAALRANNSLCIPAGSSLTVYGQSGDSGALYAKGYYDDDDGRAGIICEGSLTINGGTVTALGGYYAAGIGSNENGSCGDITVNGGQVLARGGVVLGHSVKSGKPFPGVGIGGDRGEGVVTISGGTVTAEGGSMNAGIGGNGRTVTINGGVVEASGGNGGHIGAGIGGSDGANGPITINGGTVTATAINPDGSYRNSAEGAGIGAGCFRAQGGKIVINGGTVTATGFGMGAGIGGAGGGGNAGNAGGEVEIRGADTCVIAASLYGAGIGGAGGAIGVNDSPGGRGGTVTVYDGCVFAMSSMAGAGIGGGYRGNGGTLTVYGGYVVACGGSSSYSWYDSDAMDTVGRGTEGFSKDPVKHFSETLLYEAIADLVLDLIFSDDYCGAGIGGGDRGSGGTVTVHDGVVIAVAGGKGANAFGKGEGGGSNGSLAVYEEARVTYGDHSGGDIQIEGIAPAAERVSRCQEHDYARIEPCEHDEGGLSYTVSARYHTADCAYCETTFGTKSHSFDEENRCVDCGYQGVQSPGDTGSVFGSGGAAAAIAAAGALVGAGLVYAVMRKRNHKKED